MRTISWKTLGLAVVPALAIALIAVASPAMPASGAPDGLPGITGELVGTVRTFELQATNGRISVPDGNSIYMWGFAENPGTFQYPGPVLIAKQGETIQIHLTNNLTVDTSIAFPGQVGVMADTGSGAEPVQPEFGGDGTLTSLTTSVGPAETITYSFDAHEPGTYLYESGTDPSLQVLMGLFGMLVIRPDLGVNYAYNDSSTEFDPEREYMLLLHEIDPVINSAVERGEPVDLTAFWPRNWTINGRCFPDTLAADSVPWLPGQPYGALVTIEQYQEGDAPALIRFANAGSHSHPLHTHSNHIRIVGHNGRLLASGGENVSVENFTTTVGPSHTYDGLFTWTDIFQWDPETNPIPVQIPDYRNLGYAGTWYSGSPYLGHKGELPVDQVTMNEMGEFYYPWHTHSEREMVNWGGEMGGMMTFLRINPPTG